ncbi:hypothetical protein GE061_018221 [Apolygus lucorum]|uniref:GRIP domain-containing protein n=1 Tax=Apolygus lucorum TaxID=248454 RepID=A0A8S9XEN3_APOLU|nr:hypothetical protein GE061_018221 [Apolygus lucorum]
MEPSTSENVESPQGDLSREKLVQKCKNLLAIAQKAKIARDEALEERGKLQKEIEASRAALKNRDQQYKNVEEIMGVLTEQKLKLAMDIDTLKKEKSTFFEQIQKLSNEKETFETEAESFKRQYNRLLAENEDLIGELQIRERSESQLLNDIKKLHENNESVKILCTNVTQEKLHLEEELEKLSRNLEETTAERVSWNQALSSRLGVDHVDVKTLLNFIDGFTAKSPEIQPVPTNAADETLSLLAASQRENDSLQQEVNTLKDKLQKLMSDLETANVDRDQMMNNLEDVQVETKTLIDNVEKLNEEVDVAKEEKTKSEAMLNKVIESQNEEIDNLLKELSKNKSYINELLSNMESHMENSNKYSEMNIAFKEKSEELLRCKDEIEAMKKASSEVRSGADGISSKDCNVLLILKEGIVSNLTDLADTMPEYSKEFLNKLNSILEGADCKEGEGADIFVHYFNECLSQLKISLKENEILSKEVVHLNNSVKELENLVAAHNKDCEQLRSEVEELSADSNRLLHDLGGLRHENSLRVSEVGELVVRLKQKDEELDQLKEQKNHLEFELHEQIVELSSKLTDSNNNVILLQDQNKQLELKCQTIVEEAQSEAAKELLALREELNKTAKSVTTLQSDLEKSIKALHEKSEQMEDLKKLHADSENAREVFESSKVEMKRYMYENELLKKQLSESNEVLEKQTKELEDVLQLVAESAPLKVELEKSKADLSAVQLKLENAEKSLEEMEMLKKNLEDLRETCQAKSLQLEKSQEILSGNSTLMNELEEVREALTKKTDELKSAEIRLNERASLIDELSEIKEELAKKSELIETYCEQLNEMETLRKENEKINEVINSLKERQLQLEADKERLLEDLKASREHVQAIEEKLEATKKESQEFEKTLTSIQTELEKATNGLAGKALVEEELSQLKGIQQRTMEELENTKKLLNESQSIKKQMQESEKVLKSKTSELEKLQKLLNDKHLVDEELDNLKKEMKLKVEELETLKSVISENQCVKENAQQLEATLKLKTDELESSQKLLADLADLKLEEEFSIMKDSYEKETESLKMILSKLENMVLEKETQLAMSVKRLEESDAEKKILTTERDALLAKVAEMEKGICALGDSQSQAVKLREEISLLQKAVEDHKKTAVSESEEKQKIIIEIKQLCEKVQSLQVENNALQGKLTDQGRAMNEELKKKNVEIKKLLNELDESKEMVNFKKMELDDINCIWAGRLNSLKVNLHSLGRSIHELGRQSAELQAMFLNKICSLKYAITDKAETVVELSVAEAKKELVDEMHRMNEVLKDRGEAIAKLQDCLAETESKVEALNKKNIELVEEQTKFKSEIQSKEEKLSSKEATVKDLEMELTRLRELKEPTHESDVLSTSTISRTEDQMRFKDVDDSIEEKYLKLRHVAVRLKKRVSELTQALDQEKSKSTDKSEILEKMQHLSSAAKNAQKVQESYDKTLDELEEAKKQNSAMAASLKEMTGSVEALKKQVASLESSNANIPLMHKQVESLNSNIKELKSELNKLEMEKKVEVMKYEETKKQCVTLESKVESLSQSLDQAVQQGRSNNVLELEMKNYEKVIADLTAQLNSEKQKLANAEKECSSISLVKSGLEEQIALLEKQVSVEESRNANLQDQVTSMRENSSSCQRQTEELNSQMLDLKRELQHAKSTGEQQALEMSALTSEFSRKEMDLQIKMDSFSSHIQSLETSLATIKQELLTSNSEKEHLREEFESYRLRAQSTLARQKGDAVSQGEKEAREQCDKLKKELEGAREKIENNQTEIETMNNKLSSLQLEKARSDKRYEDITKALHQKITDYDTLNTEYRAFKFSAETLLQNTKIEFEETERSLKEEIETLKDLVNSLNEKVSLEVKEVSYELETKNSGVGSNFFEAVQSHENLLSLQEREDGEGSESVPPPMNNFRRMSNLVPLDILLNNPIDDENRIPVLQEKIEKLHSELNSYEVRVKHLASLLSEAEKDSARSSQQNAVLKEELRRLERSLQREPHIANSEYLKNVIFKFLVLQNGDERTRLVPVLDTILKLSPEETSRLTAVARGESASSWGSYLHSWTGL